MTGTNPGSSAKVRIETDSFGPIEVAADKYWGALAQRSRAMIALDQLGWLLRQRNRQMIHVAIQPQPPGCDPELVIPVHQSLGSQVPLRRHLPVCADSDDMTKV